MRLSKLFLPTLKENPTEAQIPSHRLMLRAGMIRQSSAGIYTWLPLGCTVLKKIETIRNIRVIIINITLSIQKLSKFFCYFRKI